MDIHTVLSMINISNNDIKYELQILEQLNRDININDKLVFGEKEIKEELENFSLEKIIIHKSLNIPTNYNCQIIEISSLTKEGELFLQNYGGIIGYKWF